MRLTDDRYANQRFRLEVALRMIRHEARTSTIRECTGVTEDRIRKLYRTYFSNRGSRPPHRKRGKSPQQTHCLTHNLRSRTDAALFAGILHAMGVTESHAPLAKMGFDPIYASQICDAYELFVKLRPVQPCDFSFEHAWFLVRALREGTEISAARCSRCAGLTLSDIYSPQTTTCPLCETMELAKEFAKPTKARAPRRHGRTGKECRPSARLQTEKPFAP